MSLYMSLIGSKICVEERRHIFGRLTEAVQKVILLVNGARKTVKAANLQVTALQVGKMKKMTFPPLKQKFAPSYMNKGFLKKAPCWHPSSRMNSRKVAGLVME